MTESETVFLQAQQAQLLMYSMGYRRAYGFLPAEPPGRQQALRLFLDLVRKGILLEQNGSLVLQSPWKDCLQSWGEADAVVRLHLGDTSSPDCCCYPCGKEVMICTPQPRYPQMLRLTRLPRTELWAWMKQNYQLPSEAEGTLACEREEVMDTALAQDWQTDDEPEHLPGFLYLLERHSRDGTPIQRLAAVQRPLYRQLLLKQQGEIRRLPYREEVLQRCLQEWIGAEKEGET